MIPEEFLYAETFFAWDVSFEHNECEVIKEDCAYRCYSLLRFSCKDSQGEGGGHLILIKKILLRYELKSSRWDRWGGGNA